MLKTHVYILILLTVLTVEDTCIIYTNIFDCTDLKTHVYILIFLTVLTVEDTCIFTNIFDY